MLQETLNFKKGYKNAEKRVIGGNVAITISPDNFYHVTCQSQKRAYKCTGS